MSPCPHTAGANTGDPLPVPYVPPDFSESAARSYADSRKQVEIFNLNLIFCYGAICHPSDWKMYCRIEMLQEKNPAFNL